MDDVQTRNLLRRIAEQLGCDRRNIVNNIKKLQDDVIELTLKNAKLTCQLAEQSNGD